MVGSENGPATRHEQRARSHPCGIWSLVITLACSVLNLAVWSEFHGSAFTHSPLTRPSTYIGLTELKRNRSEETSLNFTNFPPIMTQVSLKQPSRVWPDDSLRRLLDIGTISPDARRFFVSPEVSSVAQFRAIDFGFENCSLRFSLKPPVQHNVTVGPNPSTISVWLLDSPSRINVQQLSWANRPPRLRLLDAVVLSYGSLEETQSIRCPWGSFQTFEFSCERDCLLDFWQDPQIPEIGVTMVQRSSLI